jgi:acetyl/propionyl-CoA carboxylase alpha subunit
MRGSWQPLTPSASRTGESVRWGGGKGMRVALDQGSLAEAVPAARREAQAAFGDGTLYVERLVQRPATSSAGVRRRGGQYRASLRARLLHSASASEGRRGEPIAGIDAALRRRMGEAAIAAARTAGYQNAGTLEFLVEGTGDEARFYFSR